MDLNIEKKTYGKKVIFLDTNFHTNSRITFIKGQNGSGKSTLLNILSNVDKDFSGNFSDDYNEKDIVFITQHFQLYKNLTIKENIELFNKDNTEKIVELLFYLDIKASLNDKLKNLSGGQRKKVQLAILLSNNCKYVLIDEPDNYLDESSKKKLVNFIMKDTSKSYIIVSHELEDYFNNIYPNQSSLVEISDKKIYTRRSSDNTLLSNNELNPPASSINIFKKLLLQNKILAIFSLLLMLFLNFNIFFQYSKFQYYHDYIYNQNNQQSEMQLNNTSSLIYAPVFSQYYTPFKDKAYTDKIPLYFRKHENNLLKKQDFITKIIPIPSYSKQDSVSLYTDKDGTKYETSNAPNNAQFNELTIPYDVCSNIPPLLYLGSEKLTGDCPKDGSNEVILTEKIAKEYAEKLNLTNVNSLIGKNIAINSHDFMNDVTKTLNFKVSGISSSNGFGENIFVPYNSNSSTNKKYINNYSKENVEAHYYISDEYVDFLNYYDKNDIYDQGYYVEVKSPDNLKTLTKLIDKYDPYIETINNYSLKENNTTKFAVNAYKSSVKSLILSLIIFIFTSIILYSLGNYLFNKKVTLLKYHRISTDIKLKFYRKYSFIPVITLSVNLIIIYLALLFIKAFNIWDFSLPIVYIFSILNLVLFIILLGVIKYGKNNFKNK